jgi:hypothetical protein
MLVTYWLNITASSESITSLFICETPLRGNEIQTDDLSLQGALDTRTDTGVSITGERRKRERERERERRTAREKAGGGEEEEEQMSRKREKEKQAVIRRTIEPFSRDDPGWERLPAAG